MQRFGDVLFSGRPFIRWTLLPVLLFCVAVFGVMAFSAFGERDFIAGGGMSLLVIGCIAMMISMLVPNATWSIRIVTGLVFAAYAWYLVHEWIIDFDGDIGFGRPRSEANPNNALAGFIVIGLPALWYTVLGRFTLRQEDPSDNEEFEGPDNEAK